MPRHEPAPALVGGSVSPGDASRQQTGERGWLEKILSLLAPVEPGEGPTALLLTANVFLLLLAYYLLKVVREPLILMSGGAEVKTYASAGQSVLLIFAVKGYDLLSRRLPRAKLIAAVSLFFAACLVAFFALGVAGVPLGVPFYLWVGIFNVAVIAQFWSFAADVYTPEQGKRLFAILGVGSSVGAVAGARIAKGLFERLGPFGLMLAAAGVLVGSLGLSLWVNRREAARAEQIKAEKEQSQAPLGPEGPIDLLKADRYLVLIGVMILLLNWVNTTGEYLLDRTLLEAAKGMGEQAQRDFIAEFKGDFFGWVNLVGVVMQLFVVSRILKYAGVRVALAIMPVVALAGYSTLALGVVSLGLVRLAKIAENSLDYSLENTAKQALWLVTSREAKYKVKSAIDTFLVRAGDVLAALAIWAGTSHGMGVKSFATLNAALVVGWLLVALVLGKIQQSRAKEQEG